MENKRSGTINISPSWISLPQEVWCKIFMKLDTITSILSVSKVCKEWNRITTADILKKFCKRPDVNKFNFYDVYWKYGCLLVYDINILDNVRIKHLNDCLQLACQRGDYYVIKKLLRHNPTKLNDALDMTCFNGSVECAILIINAGANGYNKGLTWACMCGNVNCARFMIKLGASNINESLEYTYKNNNRELIRLLEDNGANNINKALIGACAGNNIDNVRNMIANGATAFNEGLRVACYNGHLDIVMLMEQCGATNITLELHSACRSGNIDLVKYILFNDVNVNDGLMMACAHGYINIVKELIYCGVDDYNKIIKYAFKFGQIALCKYMIKEYYSKYNNYIDINHVLRWACYHGNIKYVNELIQLGANNWNWGLYGACAGGNIRCIKLMISYGANDFNGGLFYSCENSKINIASKLIDEYGANNFSETLINACVHYNVKMVKLMLRCGANPDVFNDAIRALFEHAWVLHKDDFHKIIKILFAHDNARIIDVHIIRWLARSNGIYDEIMDGICSDDINNI